MTFACHFLTSFFHHLTSFFLFFSIPFQVMPKCADVQLQLGSDKLLQDIKDIAFFRKLQRLGSYTFGKALHIAMKQGGLPEIDAWICPSAVLARPLEAHERRHRHPEFDVWIVLDTVAKTWQRDSCWDKVLAFCVVFGFSAVWEGVGRFTHSCR